MRGSEGRQSRDQIFVILNGWLRPEYELETEERFSQACMNELFDYGLLRGRESAWAGSIFDTGEEPAANVLRRRDPLHSYSLRVAIQPPAITRIAIEA